MSFSTVRKGEVLIVTCTKNEESMLALFGVSVHNSFLPPMLLDACVENALKYVINCMEN